MLQSTHALTRLLAEFKKLPGIGERTALRLAFHLLKSPDNVLALADALQEVRVRVRFCSVCHGITEQDPCELCGGEREAGLVCVVEEPQDVLAVERSGAFRGRYHVLHGALSPLQGVSPADLTIEHLLQRIEQEGVREVVLATNFSVEGEATALYLARLLKPCGVRVTRLAHGIPIGSDLEFVDAATVQRALEGRAEL